ncbi:MAG: hypothetical protein KF770_30920 [Anaerolineae bacterium]|nr:hypothetical protein [Anaerolineae bacterium]
MDEQHVGNNQDSSETNWEMIDALMDETIDRSELPPMDDSFFTRASWVRDEYDLSQLKGGVRGKYAQRVWQDTFPMHPDREQMLREIEAFKLMHRQLVQEHLGQYVAIFQGKLVDHDSDPVALLQRIKQKYPDQVVLRRKVEE